ncbi:MAG: hypothetical protein IKK04_04540 [Bacteroidales bacterium]|nr:hypothetical protein [Bacteroidales bacterium]
MGEQISIFDVGVTDTEMPGILESEFRYALKLAADYWRIRKCVDVLHVPTYYKTVIHNSCAQARQRLTERGVDLNRSKHFRLS